MTDERLGELWTRALVDPQGFNYGGIRRAFARLVIAERDRELLERAEEELNVADLAGEFTYAEDAAHWLREQGGGGEGWALHAAIRAAHKEAKLG